MAENPPGKGSASLEGDTNSMNDVLKVVPYGSAYIDTSKLISPVLCNVDLELLNESLVAVQGVANTFSQFSNVVQSLSGAMEPWREVASRHTELTDHLAFPQVSLPTIVTPKIALPDSLLAQIAKTTRAFGTAVADMVRAAAPIGDFSKSMLEVLRPSLDALQKVLADYDSDGFWTKCGTAAREWGGLGWVIIDDMPVDMLFSCPETYPEANRLCRKMAFAQLGRLKRELPGTVRRSADADEMVSLFEEGHYKSCAMMACSLIDGELMNWKIIRTRNRKANSNPKELRAYGHGRSAQEATVSLLGVVEAYSHFFQSGKGFNRSREGELNRNFLMHGMMNKQVAQIACIKLFLLLDKVVGLLPYCEVAE